MAQALRLVDCKHVRVRISLSVNVVDALCKQIEIDNAITTTARAAMVIGIATVDEVQLHCV